MMTHFFFAAFKVFCLSHFLVAGNNTPHPQIEGGVYAGFYFRSVVAGYQERKAQQKGLAEMSCSCHGDKEAEKERAEREIYPPQVTVLVNYLFQPAPSSKKHIYLQMD